METYEFIGIIVTIVISALGLVWRIETRMSRFENRLEHRISDFESQLGNRISDIEYRLGERISRIEGLLEGYFMQARDTKEPS